MSKQNDIWNNAIYGNVHKKIYGLLDISLDAYRDQDPDPFYILVLLHIIKYAAIDRDCKYFKSLAFAEHCWLLRISRYDILKLVNLQYGGRG